MMAAPLCFIDDASFRQIAVWGLGCHPVLLTEREARDLYTVLGNALKDLEEAHRCLQFPP